MCTIDWNLLDNERRGLTRRIKLRNDFAIGYRKPPILFGTSNLRIEAGAPRTTTRVLLAYIIATVQP